MTIDDGAALAVEITQRSDPKRMGPAALFVHKPAMVTLDPTTMAATQWRAIVSRAPIVRTCIATLVLQLLAVPYEIRSKDERKVEYYQSVLDHANDEDFSTFLMRLIQDTLSVPFGGAFETTRDSDNVVVGIYHVDGGSLLPTYDPKQPYVQIDPSRSYNRVYFGANELIRVPWLMRSDLLNYGWSFTPVMDSYAAVESLIRSDIFYNTLLSDTPPPGILDMLDMTKNEAEEWLEGFREMYTGIDRFKIPILYDHKEPAQWIPFQDSSTLRELPNIIRRYAEIVTAAFGMSIVDLGLYEYSQTKAGSVAQINISKRQGLGSLMARIAGVFNSLVFPDDVEFVWKPIDEEDKVRRATANKMRIDGLARAVEIGALNQLEMKQILITEEIVTLEMPKEGLPPEEWEPEGEEEEAGIESAPEGEEEEIEQSLYGLVLDDDHVLHYDWEDCGLPPEERALKDPKPRAFKITDPSYRQMLSIFEKSQARIIRKLSKSVIRRAVDAVWGKFPEPETRAEPSDVTASIQKVIGSRTNLIQAELDSVLATMGQAYETGLLSSTDEVWSALKANNLAKGTHGIAFSLMNPRTIEMFEANVVKLGKDLDKGTASIVSRLVSSGVKNGKAAYGSKDSVASAIHQALPKAIGRRRAQSIALFEVNKVQSQAHKDQYEALGLKKKMWDAIDAIACPLCKRNEARGFVKMDTDFETVFGPAPAPPGHPTICHCRIKFDRDELVGMASEGEPANFWNGDREVPVSVGAPLPIKTFANLQEAKAWWKQKYSNIELDLGEVRGKGGMGMPMTNAVLKEFDRLATQWPEPAKQLHFFGVRRLSGNKWAEATRDGRAIRLNSEWFAGRGVRLKESVKQSAEMGWHPAGVDTIESIVTHEYGHQIMNWIQNQGGSFAFTKSGAVRADGTGIVRDSFRTWIKKNVSQAKNVSEYALTNEEEFWAEAFVVGRHAKQVSSVARSQERLLNSIGDGRGWTEHWKTVNEIKDEAQRVRAIEELKSLSDFLGGAS